MLIMRSPGPEKTIPLDSRVTSGGVFNGPSVEMCPPCHVDDQGQIYCKGTGRDRSLRPSTVEASLDDPSGEMSPPSHVDDVGQICVKDGPGYKFDAIHRKT